MVSLPLRRRLRRTITGVAGIALLLFGLPLAVAVERVLRSEAQVTLQADAVRGVASIADESLAVSGPLLQLPASHGVRLSLYGPDGRLRTGAGPSSSGLARTAADGREHAGTESDQFAVVAPVLSDSRVVGSVRAAVPTARLWTDVVQAWALLLALAAVVLGGTVLLAGRLARNIAGPFEGLTTATQSLGAGNFALALPVTGLREADDAATALGRTAEELGRLMTQERDFVKHASHQLRTPLAGLILQLERARPAQPAALERARRLEGTLDDLLTVRVALSGDASCDPLEVVTAACEHWRATTARAVHLRAAEVDRVAAPAAAVRQALDVLLDNAVRHGGGAVTVTVEPLGSSVVVEVMDDGAGFAPRWAPGTGLRLAELLLQRFGGDLVHRRSGPRPRVALLLPQLSSSNR